ncbi:hypothetical protein COLO4_04746 [Corchorus olitorius]|uniref:RRM domain-containing protein n=1 Tax=Corchorus olitorius TaxID=93759 RepID=A0A1R3KSX8_9ROSI|nr:hypothetical protein COLO4_04746 [Corchorus olitorius]
MKSSQKLEWRPRNGCSNDWSEFGLVVDAYILTKRGGGGSDNGHKFAFVRYKKEDEAKKAIERGNGLLIDNCPIVVKRAFQQRKNNAKTIRQYGRRVMSEGPMKGTSPILEGISHSQLGATRATIKDKEELVTYKSVLLKGIGNEEATYEAIGNPWGSPITIAEITLRRKNLVVAWLKFEVDNKRFIPSVVEGLVNGVKFKTDFGLELANGPDVDLVAEHVEQELISCCNMEYKGIREEGEGEGGEKIDF